MSAACPHNAACTALLMARGKGKEAEQLTDSERAHLTHQALVWLRDDLAAQQRVAMGINRGRVPQFLTTLLHWQHDSDLATVRDEKHFQQLPADDQELCRRLWTDHAVLVKSLQARAPVERN